MRLNIIISFEDCYEFTKKSIDFRYCSFETETDNGPIILHVSIEENKNPFVGEVFNLAFGPLKADGTIDDFAIIRHNNPSRVFSTILFAALSFLSSSKENDAIVGIDGSNKVRAYLYYRIFQGNFEYLSDYFSVSGIKYYVRLIRGDNKDDPFLIDVEDIKGLSIRITKGLAVNTDKLFNYFVFKRA